MIGPDHDRLIGEINVAARRAAAATEACHDAIGVAPEGVIKERLERAHCLITLAATLIGEAHELSQPAVEVRLTVRPGMTPETAILGALAARREAGKL